MPVEMSMKLSPKQAGKLYQKSMKQEDRIKELESLLNEFITEHGDRDSDSDIDDLLPADDQDCSIVARAMELLDQAV